MRLRKARQWLSTYEGSHHIIRNYRKRFKIDVTCALRDLGEIGALAPEKLATLQKAEQKRLAKMRQKREEVKQQEIYERYSDSDDTFFYIEGYTSGGAPYGVTWEEMGMEPWDSFEVDDD